MTSQTARRLPKILMLHGYTQNASIFSKRVAAVRKACQGQCEMVFVDAPHVVQLASSAAGAFDKLDSIAVANPSEDTDPALIPRTWWRFREEMGEGNEPRKIYEGFDETMQLLRRVIDDQGPFEACLGFSQGAALAAILSSVLETPSLHATFSEPPLLNQEKLKAVILVAGFKLDFPRGWYADGDHADGKLKTRSLHVLGRTDAIVGEDRTQPLVDSYLRPRVEWHDGGHFVPAKKNWRDFFSRYIQSLNMNDDSLVPSPGQTSDTVDTAPKM